MSGVKYAVLVSVLACACGSSGKAMHDATAIDGAADAPFADTHVTVHVTDHLGDGWPDPTAIVLFYAGDELVHDGTVDANGDAVWDLPYGGTVTVLQIVNDTQNNRIVDDLTTFRGVKPGDRGGWERGRQFGDGFGSRLRHPVAQAPEITGPKNPWFDGEVRAAG